MSNSSLSEQEPRPAPEVRRRKRLLLVDDEPLLLEALSRGLRSAREEFELGTAASGVEALRLMQQQPFDVVVSDMRMPGMSGSELLKQIAELYPQTTRLILSGYADPTSILACVSYTHQYLPKPCDSQTLRAAIGRATTPGVALNNESIKDLVGRMDRLPSVPALYAQIVEKLRSRDTDLEDIAFIISQDIAMTAKVLRLVNSGYFGLAQQVTSLLGAVLYLGLDTLKCLVLSVHAFSQLESAQQGSVHLDTLWNHSLATASAARAIARHEKVSQATIDHAVVGGMLHDTGKLVLASNFPSEYSEIMRRAENGASEIIAAEIEIFGAHHAEVGGYLLGLWGLPAPVVEAIALHHSPSSSKDTEFTALTAVHAANALVLEQANEELNVDADYLAALGLGDRLDAWRNAIRTSRDPASS